MKVVRLGRALAELGGGAHEGISPFVALASYHCTPLIETYNYPLDSFNLTGDGGREIKISK